jgi:hypothetical protein
MKTLEEVLNRKDYQRLSSLLDERVQEAAKQVREKLDFLDEKRIGDYSIRTVKGNGYEYHFLADFDGMSLEDDKSYYYGGDFNCLVEPAPHKSKLKFLNALSEIVNSLSEIEDEKCIAIEKALK